MWSEDSSKFRGRHHLALESVLIHHPQATLIIFSSTLNDSHVCLPYRQRGYDVYSFNISLNHIVQWKWYLGNQSRDFLQHSNWLDVHSHSHMRDYVRLLLLYRYGGTFLNMDTVLLRPLPDYEFIESDRPTVDENCTSCPTNTSGFHLTSDLMRFRPRRLFLRVMFEQSFNSRSFNRSCVDCVTSRILTEHFLRHRSDNTSEWTNVTLLQRAAHYLEMQLNSSSMFHDVQHDTSLQLDDLIRRRHALHLLDEINGRRGIARGSLVDLLFDRLDLGNARLNIPKRAHTRANIGLVHPSVYVDTGKKQGQFIGADVIYLRSEQVVDKETIRWNVKIAVSNGTIILPAGASLFDLSQAQVNRLFREIAYRPSERTAIDQLTIHLESNSQSLNCSLTILVFSQWVTFITKTMGTYDRWTSVKRLAKSIDKFFPQSDLHIASDSGRPINRTVFFRFLSSNGQTVESSSEHVFIHDLPEDSGLSFCRNYLVNLTSTPFFFLLDDDFALEEDSHLDRLLELLYTKEHMDIVAGKIPEDLKTYLDFSGVFLHYNRTLDMTRDVPAHHPEQALFTRRSANASSSANPCREVDFVPNVFLGRTSAVRSIGWNNRYKVGEHEEFFLRFRKAHRTVYSCRHIQVHHHQSPWWLQRTDPYYKKRTRVYKYFEDMMKHNGFRKMIAFNYVHVDFDRQSLSEKKQ